MGGKTSRRSRRRMNWTQSPTWCVMIWDEGNSDELTLTFPSAMLANTGHWFRGDFWPLIPCHREFLSCWRRESFSIVQSVRKLWVSRSFIKSAFGWAYKVMNWNECMSNFMITSASTWHTLTENRPFSDFLSFLGMCATLLWPCWQITLAFKFIHWPQ